jgi:hypothetical protein
MNLKDSYFSSNGKSGWNKLKKSTIKRKGSDIIHIDSGALHDSLFIRYEKIENGYRIIFGADYDDKILKSLRFKYGRDFITFDKNEKEFIKKRLLELIKKNAE